MSEQHDDPWMIDRLLAGEPAAGDPPAGDPPTGGSTALADLLSAATAPGTPGELAGEEAVMAAFLARSSGISSPSHPSRARRLPLLSTLLAGKVVAAAAAGGIAIAGTAAAAYTGNLPDALQDVAHQTIGAPAAGDNASADRPEAPAATPTDSRSTDAPVGPDASGKAAYGLCTAWDKGGLSTKSVAYEALVKAAGDASKIEAYCKTVERPGGAPTDHATGAPTTPPGKPTARPTQAPESKPTTHTTGAPADVPTPTAPGAKPTGR